MFWSESSAAHALGRSEKFAQSVKFMTVGMILFFLLFFQASLNLRLATAMKVELPTETEKAHRWDPRLFKVLSFGHLPAAIDWMWIQVLLDQTLKPAPAGEHPWIYYHLDLITDLDPPNFSSYKAGAHLVAIVRKDGEGARLLVEKGERFRKTELATYPDSFKKDYWGNAWALPLLLAYLQLFERSDLPKAADAFREAAAISGSPAYLQHLMARFEKPGGQYEVGLRLLNFMIAGEKNEDAKERLIQKRDSLYMGQFLHDLNWSFAQFKLIHAKDSKKGDADLYQRFQRQTHSPSQDPWGGKLSLDETGKIMTSTAHDRVLGLD